jgi:hypothetical protein
MSTSPSWFDQDKLSNLAKKVGKKTVTEVLPTNIGAIPVEDRPAESLASTARISLVSKPPSLLSDQRALPALPRRTGTLPSIKSLFPNSNPSVAPDPIAPPAVDQPAPEPVSHGTDSREAHPVIPSGQEEGDLSEIWHKMSLLNEELAKTVLERDQAHTDIGLLREQLKHADETLKEVEEKEAQAKESAPAPDELAKLTKERDDAIADGKALRAQLLIAKDAAAAKEKEAREKEGKESAPAFAPEELSKLTKERDDAIEEGKALRAQLLQAKDAAAKDKENFEKDKNTVPAITPEELAKVARERDAAMEEIKSLTAQLLKAKENPVVPLGDTQEITIVTGERDQARRQYADLRKQYEALKLEQAPKEETMKYRKEWELQMEERDKEIAALKAAAGDEKMKAELASLRDQLTRAKDEASVAQRGLALSQKALQQTRDTLREATEGTSLSRHNFDNLKNECAILAQQNTVLQAQNDQLSRDLNASKSKITTRLSH